MSPTVTEIAPPAEPVFRVGNKRGPLGPVPWRVLRQGDPRLARDDDLRIGGRFDDPASRYGYPEARRFRTVYFASQRVGAFGEVLGPRQVPVDRLGLQTASQRIPRGLENVRNAEDLEDLYEGITDVDDPTCGIIPGTWLSNRRVAMAMLDRGLRFVDLTSADTIQYLRLQLAGIAADLKLPDVDYSTVVGPNRSFTQAVASHAFEIIDDDRDAPAYDGIYYRSRFSPEWGCWAVFDRSLGSVERVSTQDIDRNDADLLAAASLLRLRVATEG